MSPVTGAAGLGESGLTSLFPDGIFSGRLSSGRGIARRGKVDAQVTLGLRFDLVILPVPGALRNACLSDLVAPTEYNQAPSGRMADPPP